MKRVWMWTILTVFLAVPQWLAAPARGQNAPPYPSANSDCEWENACPYEETLQPWGECPWACDREHQHAAPADGDAAPESDALAATEVETAENAATTVEDTATNATPAPGDCWYDGATDSYYDYEFSNTDMICEEPPETAAESETVEICADEAADVASDPYDAWNGSYEFPSETVVSEQAAEESYWAEDATDAECGDESMYPYEGTDDLSDEAAESETADAQTTATSESSEKIREGTADMETTELDADTTPVAETADDDYNDFEPDRYDYGQDADSASVPTWGEPGENVEWLEGEATEDVPAAPATAAAVESDSSVILSLARTLDRVSVTLHTLSRYLTEMATADLAKRPSATLER